MLKAPIQSPRNGTLSNVDLYAGFTSGGDRKRDLVADTTVHSKQRGDKDFRPVCQYAGGVSLLPLDAHHTFAADRHGRRGGRENRDAGAIIEMTAGSPKPETQCKDRP